MVIPRVCSPDGKVRWIDSTVEVVCEKRLKMSLTMAQAVGRFGWKGGSGLERNFIDTP